MSVMMIGKDTSLSVMLIGKCTRLSIMVIGKYNFRHPQETLPDRYHELVS